MVTTRRGKQAEKHGEEANDVEATSKKSPSKKTRRQKLNEELKSKATGVGLKISVDTTPKNNKIVFDDVVDEPEPPVEKQEVIANDEYDEDEEDDAVEEVKGQAAREEILEQLDTEAKYSVHSKKKRKKKEKPKEVKEEEEEEEEFDDAFFAELEAARAEEKKQLEDKKPKGKHTAFVVAQSDQGISERPREVDENIQVVVLKDSAQDSTVSAITAVPTNALTQNALLYSRNRLVSGSDGVARSALGKKRKWQPDNTWKRSKKMKNLVRVNRKGGRLAPANFAKKR
eukprot:scaffold4157_cov136-Cylindrotheca_fusiformis.AAC.14